ncbi:hypothetical protein AAG906_003274 [Vitis piasezkii]
MASGGGLPMPRRDPTWKYCSLVEGNRNGTICNFCGLLMKSGDENDDEDAKDEDVYMYPTDMYPNEWDANRFANIVGNKCKTGKSSRSTVVPTMSFVYELMHMMKENLIHERTRDWIFKIIKDRWEKTLKHPLHAATYFLNPRFQYRRGVGSDPELLQAVYDIFAKLDPTTESLGQFGNEMQKKDVVIKQRLQQGQPWCPVALNSHQEVESTSVGHSSRPSAAGTSTSGYDGSRRGTNDGGDNAKGDIWERQQSQYPISQFTCENDFTHCTQDEDHGSRRANPGIGVIGKPRKGRERTMEAYNEELLSRSFESMSIRTQFSDSSNEANIYPLHVMSYGQPSSSTNEEYGMLCCSPSTQMSYQCLIHVEAVGMTQEIYAWHVRIFNQYYRAVELVPILSPTTRRGSFIYQSH